MFFCTPRKTHLRKLADEFEPGHSSSFNIDVAAIETTFGDAITAYNNLCPCQSGFCPCPPGLIIIDEIETNDPPEVIFLGANNQIVNAIPGNDRGFYIFNIDLFNQSAILFNSNSGKYELTIRKTGFDDFKVSMTDICNPY